MDFSTKIEGPPSEEGIDYGEDPSESNNNYFDGIFSREYPDPVSPNLSAQNYVYKRTYRSDNKNSYLDQIQYYDGLGRPHQIVQVKITPTQKDLVSLQEYDSFGRESNRWLPGAVTNNNGALINTSLLMAASQATNMNSGSADQNPFSKTVYEESPLNRILEKYGPGQDWHTNRKNIKTALITNKYKAGASFVLADSLVCAKYISTDDLNQIRISRTDNYAANDLYVTRIKDEGENTSYEFKNKSGQVILSRQINESNLIDTYFVYDSYGNLRIVIPPEASTRLLSSSGWTETDDTMKQYAYLYKYDSRNRCIAKKIPGCDWIFYIYDKADQLILSQDGEQRLKSEWLFTKYDITGRVVLTGEVVLSNTYQELQNIIKTKVIQEKFNINSQWSYTWTSLQGLIDSHTYKRILSVNYYDNYKFRKRVDFEREYFAYEETTQEYNTRYGIDESQYKHKGLLTGNITAIMNGADEVHYLYSAMYYDDQKRLIQTKGNNHLTGGIEKEYIAYNFTGQPVKKLHVHTKDANGGGKLTELYTYTYDHAGRLLTTTHQLTDGTTVKPQVTLAENSYDDLGRLKTNKKGGVAGTLATYAYNVRSWTKSITSPLFTETLYYNETYGGSVKQYNGNISAMSWKQLTEPLRYYAYSYDNLSRLTNANYGEDNNATNRFTTSYSYDKHGNMKTLTRRGNTDGSGTNGMVDNLTMTHNGNQLAKVSDTGVSVPMSSSMDFKDYSNVATEYTYNANGAMNKDLNKGISDIQYNSLNLPRMMDIKSPVAEARNEYTYSASGQKLKVVQKWNPNFSTAPVIGSGINTTSLTQTKTTDYTGNIIYENNALKRILVDGGYYEGGVYYYYLADHLGNNHVVVKSDGTSIQSLSYYPFGMHFAPGGGYEKQPYKYNNKELDQMHGLNMYDNLARLYDPVIPHTPTPDPHAENYYSWSPYAWVGNNPLSNIDPDGMDYWSTSDPELIRQFMNSMGSGASVHNMSGWNHATDTEFLGRGTFNDETGKFHTSYASYKNGVATVTGVTLDTNIKPGLTSDGFGYSGAFVYKYDNQFWATLGYHTYEITLGSGYIAPFDPTRYYDGITNWQVNTDGRITGLAPIIGYPPGVGKGGKGSGKGGKFGGKTGRKANPDRVNKWTEEIETLQEQLKKATTKAEKQAIQDKIKHARLKQKASEPHGRKGQG
ncbi:DUF6443 domain-containing protein [Dysgonomonas termitidis]|uniref:DUF6443 domain-containing protein n=1 Tax=Dysgonomonas termitidis TaxID=1516126 RepID=A0ABV9KVR9_9BACT